MEGKGRRIWIFVPLLLVLAAVLFLVFGFHVNSVVVSGNSHFAAGEIAEDFIGDFPSDNSLYLLWRYRKGNPPDSMAYLESLNVSLKSPGTIRLKVAEKPLAGYFDTGNYIYFDNSGVVLEVTRELYEGIPLIKGITIGEVTLFQKVPTQSSAQLRTILSLLELLDYQELEADEIVFGEDSQITVVIGKIQAELGQDEYLEEKVANLNAVLKTMDGTERGTLHLENVTGKNEDITFSASKEKETESEESEAAAGLAGIDSASEEIGEESGGEEEKEEEEEEEEEQSSRTDLMAFNSYGQLVTNVRVEDGKVLDAYGSEVPGCSVNEDGYLVDAYMNEIDPATGELMN